MRQIYNLILAGLFTALFVSCATAKQAERQKRDISPFEYGLASARTGIERYQAILKAHTAAVNTGVNVDYTGIDTVRLEIPAKAEQIPLTSYNDFKGCVFIIKNTTKHIYLFKYAQGSKDIALDKQMIDVGDFRTIKALKQGRALLLIEDEIPWVQNRRGYAYGHTRKDILLIENGIAQNKTVMPYKNDYSQPKCTYISLNDKPLVIKNISLLRDKECTYVTHIFQISGYNDVSLSGVSIYTPENTLHGDHAISIENCTNISFDNVHIEGTYSQRDNYGYGISLNNVWNFKATRLYGNGGWGVFGNNNVNTASIEDSKINRFDVHCYGRDISFNNVEFFDLYNQYASVYGTIQYDRCTFTDFIPVLNGGSYNSFVEHKMVMNDCVINASPGKNVIFKFSHLNEEPNSRKELSEKCLPNVRIENLKVNLRDGADAFYLFWSSASGKSVSEIGKISEINVDGLTLYSDNGKPVKEVVLSNIPIEATNPIDCKISNVEVIQSGARTKSSKGVTSVTLKTNMNIKGGKVELKKASVLQQ